MLATVLGYVTMYLVGLYLVAVMGIWTTSLVTKEDWATPVVVGLFIWGGGLIAGLLILGYSLASIIGV